MYVSTHCYLILVNAFLSLFFFLKTMFIKCTFFKLQALHNFSNFWWGLILTVIQRVTEQSSFQPGKIVWSQTDEVVPDYVCKDTCQITALLENLDAVWNIFPWFTATQTHNINFRPFYQYPAIHNCVKQTNISDFHFLKNATLPLGMILTSEQIEPDRLWLIFFFISNSEETNSVPEAITIACLLWGNKPGLCLTVVFC